MDQHTALAFDTSSTNHVKTRGAGIQLESLHCQRPTHIVHSRSSIHHSNMTNDATNRICSILTALLVSVVLLASSDALAQTIIEPGPPGTLNQAILGDTTATGERNECHYILRRDAVYIYNQRISMRADCEWIIEAEEGDGARPIIRPAALPGGEESPRQFHLFALTTLTLRNLYLDGYDTSLPDPGRPSDNAMLRIGADSARVIIDGVRFDRNRQSSIRTDNESTKFYIYNSQFSNIYNDTRPDQSFIFDTRGNPADSVVFINNTIWNHTGEILNVQSSSGFNYLKFDHNTFVNIGGVFNEPNRLDTLRIEEPGEQDVGVLSMSQSDYAVFRNNLMVNMGVVGTETQDIFTPRFIIDIDSAIVEIDSVTFDMEAPKGVDIRNNVFSFDESIASAYPDTIRLFTADEVYDPTLDLFIASNGGTGETLLAESVALNSAPGVDPQFVIDFWDFATGARERQVLFFDRDTRTVEGEGDLDFGYSTSSAAYTAGSDGEPVGDLNSFGMAEGYVSGQDEFAMITSTANELDDALPYKFALRGNYPNPFNPTTNITFDLPITAEVTIAVFDLLGREVRTIEPRQLQAGTNHSVPFDAGSLASGLYLYQVRAETQNTTLVQTGKMLLVK